MWFYWYWYEHILLGIGMFALMYYAKFYICDGVDPILCLVKYLKGKK